MNDQFSSDPMAIFATWERVLAQRVPMADGTLETCEFGLWQNTAKDAIGAGSIKDMRTLFDEHRRSQHPLRKRAQRSLKPIPKPSSEPRRMPLLIQDSECWAYDPGIAGMGLTVLEETGVKVRQWLLLDAAEKFPFVSNQTTYGNFGQEVEGLANPASGIGLPVNELVEEMRRRSPTEPLLTLPKLPARPHNPRDDRSPIERVFAQTLTGANGETFPLYEALQKRLVIEASKGTRGARALFSAEKDRIAKRAGGEVTEDFPTAPRLIARTIRFNCGKAGVGGEFEALGITASIYPRFLLYSWVLDVSWQRSGRPDDPEAFKKFIRYWVYGPLSIVPEEYRPPARVAA